MKWLFVRAVCLKIDECSVVSITPVSQHKCRSVTLKGLSGQTWFNLSFFFSLSLSPALRAQRARALHYSSSSAKWMHFLYNFFFPPFSLRGWRDGCLPMTQHLWRDHKQLFPTCPHDLRISLKPWEEWETRRGFWGHFFSIDKGPSPTQLCRNRASGACPAFYTSIKFSSSNFSKKKVSMWCLHDVVLGAQSSEFCPLQDWNFKTFCFLCGHGLFCSCSLPVAMIQREK